MELGSRGYLVSANEFDRADGALQMQGRWTFGSDDFMQILTRSDGTPDPGNCCGETLNGIEFFAFDGSDSMSITQRVNGVTTSLGSLGIDIDAGDVFDFLITDDGDSLLFQLTELGGDGSTGTLMANSTEDFAENFLVFHNRESGRTSFLDDVVVSQAQAVPEPASIAVWTLIGMALAAFGYVRNWRKK